jgi:hypothetical protein
MSENEAHDIEPEQPNVIPSTPEHIQTTAKMLPGKMVTVLHSEDFSSTPKNNECTLLSDDFQTPKPSDHFKENLLHLKTPQKIPRAVSEPLLRLKVQYETPKKSTRTFTIPYSDGPFGTPKTVAWLLQETKLRYEERHKHAVDFAEIILDDEPLCPRDALKHILEPNTNLLAKKI